MARSTLKSYVGISRCMHAPLAMSPIRAVMDALTRLHAGHIVSFHTCAHTLDEVAN